MKIIILVRILWASGAQRTAIEEAKTFIKLGHDVKIVFLREAESGTLFKPLLAGLDWEVLNKGNYSLFTPLYSYLTGAFMPDRRGEGRVDYDLIRKFPRIVKREKPDLIICHDSWSGLAGYYSFRKFKARYYVIVHEKVGRFEIPIIGKIGNWLERRALSHSNGIYAINTRIAQSVWNVYGLKATVNYHGMDIEEYTAYDQKENVILTNATWDSNRAMPQYLDIIQRLDGYKLHMVGRWRSEEVKNNFVSILEKRDLIERVVLMENLSESELVQEYLKAKFFVRFGLNESGNPHGIVSAIAHLVPPIVNSELGISDIIKQNGGGFVIEPNKTEEIIRWIGDNDNIEAYERLQKQETGITTSFNWIKHCELLLESKF